MAKPKQSDADKIAAYYESEIQKHKETAQQVVYQLQNLLAAPPGPGTNQQAEQGWKTALDFAQKLVTQQEAAAKAGSQPNPKDVQLTDKGANSAAKQSVQTIASEGQPTGSSSVFSSWFNGSQAVSQVGEQYLAAALGSKYLININNKVGVGSNTKNLGALGSIIKPGLTAAQIITTLMFNQDQNTITAIQRQLVSAGYLDPLHTTNLSPGSIGSVNDPTLQALANLLETAATGNNTIQSVLKAGQDSSKGKDYANLWDSIVTGQPFTVRGNQTNVQSAESLAGQLRNTAQGSNFGQGVLSGGAGLNPTAGETNQFVSQAQAYQQAHPSQVTTTYEPQPGLGISGFTRFPLQKSQSVVGGADQAAMDQFAYNWVVQNMGGQVAANGAANILSAFNQLLGLGSTGSGSAPSSAAGGAS